MVPTFRVVVPYVPAYKYPNGGFFVKSASLLQSMVMDRLKEVLTLQDFKGKPKGELKGLLADFIAPKWLDTNGYVIPSDLNTEMIKQVGLTMESIGINDWRASSPAIRAALEASGMAIATGDAEIRAAEKKRTAELINADRDAQALLIRAEAERQAQNKLTEARGNRIRATVARLASSLGKPDIVARGTADVLEMEAATSETSKLTTLVKDRSSVVVPVGGDKK